MAQNDFTKSATSASADSAQIVRFMRNNEVTFVARGLCPDKNAHIFVDKTNVNRYTQGANKLTVSSLTSAFNQDEEIVNLTTNAYAKVYATSNNFVYINENFININIAPYAANTLTSSTYSDQDIVFQTATNTRSGVITFIGSVERYNSHSSSTATMAIKPIRGGFRTDQNTVLFVKGNETLRTNVAAIIRGNNFPVTSTIRSLSNASKTATVTRHDHSSGIITFSNGTNQVFITGNASPYLGKYLYITNGQGVGYARTITAVSANGQLLNLSSAVYTSSNSCYTLSNTAAASSGPLLEVDDYGIVAGTLWIPETSDVYMPAGKRLITIQDTSTYPDNGYKMRAFNFYTVLGSREQSENDLFGLLVKNAQDSIAPSNPVRATSEEDTFKNNKLYNPLSQTFFIPATPNTYFNGVANTLSDLQISAIDLFFAKKPTNADLQLPVTVSIVSVSKDRPTDLKLGVSTVEAKDVKVSTIPDAANSSTVTTFKFSPPVIVKPGTEYALTVTSSSPDYNLFSANIGGSILGTTPARRVSEQPYIGSFFKAQNASNWTPIPNEDLMFRVKYASWQGSTSNTIYFVPDKVTSNINADAILLHSTDYISKPTNINYSFKSTKVDGTQDAGFSPIKKNEIYDFGGDLVTSTKTSNRRRKIVAGNRNSLNVKVDLTTSDTFTSPAIDLERLSLTAFEYTINDAGISVGDLSFTSLGNHISAANITVTFSAPDRADGVTANAYIAGLSAIDSNSVSVIVVDNPGSGYLTTPTVTISEPSAPSNATCVVAGETGSSGGNCKAKYVTRTITLADGFDAGDMRVYLDCNRPVGTDLAVYYKVKSASDAEAFEDKKWQLMKKVNDIYSKDQIQVIELEYRPNLDVNVLSYVQDGITYPLGGTFKYFAIKIVMTAKDPAVYPSVRNFRAIAVPSG